MSKENQAVENTDVELWREPTDEVGMSYYQPSIHVTKQGGIGINVGGYVFVRPLREWHKLAVDADAFAKTPAVSTDDLLRQLPASIDIDERILWLTVNKHNDGYQAGYLHGDGIYETTFSFTAPTPAEALTKLAKKIDEETDTKPIKVGS